MSATAKYSVRCQCGTAIPVERSAAGGDVSCRCGQRVKVPRLSELRRTAGEAAFVHSTVDQIHQMVKDKQLPSGNTCALSHRPTSDVLCVIVECETPYHKGGYSWWWLVIIGVFSFMCSWLVLLFYLASRERPEMVGRELVLHLPLRVATEYHAEFRRLSPGRLRGLLSAVPIYAQLLAEYPRARISVG